MPFVDKTLTCIDCKASFIFTAGEQEFHASKNFTNEPRRCSNCRQNRRTSRGDAGGGGGGYSSDRGGSRERTFSSGGDRGGFGGGGFGGGARREMFDAVCAECGKETQVPFQPSGSRPVYCRDCFSSHSPRRGGGGGGGYGGGGGRDSRSSRY